jgi:hypothetical protein
MGAGKLARSLCTARAVKRHTYYLKPGEKRRLKTERIAVKLIDTTQPFKGRGCCHQRVQSCIMELPSGAKIRPAYISTDKDIWEYLGPRYSFIGFDESTFHSGVPGAQHARAVEFDGQNLEAENASRK